MCSSDRSLKSKVLPGPTPILASFARIALSRRRLGDELQRGVEILEEVVLDPGGGGGKELDLRRGRRGWLLQEGGKRLRLVAGLDFLDVRHVVGVEELGADQRERERRGRSEDLA